MKWWYNPEEYSDIMPYRYHPYPYLWPGGDDPSSETAKKMIELKRENNKTFWPEIRKVIQQDINTIPLGFFRSWASLLIIPIISNLRYYEPLVLTTTSSYSRYLKENWVGAAEENVPNLRSFSDYDTSWQRCQNLYHLLVHNIQDKIKDMKSIVEIGGGYGDMAHLVRWLGFRGKYTIYDFPEIHQIQDFYLGVNEIKDTSLVAVPTELEPADLVIACWSLNEMPNPLQNQIYNQLRDSKMWLTVYEDIFGMDNHSWFEDKFREHQSNIVTSNFYKCLETTSALYWKE